MQHLAKVNGSKGNVYELLADYQAITCTCPSAKFRRGDCKHVKQFKLDNPDWQSMLPPLIDDDAIRFDVEMRNLKDEAREAKRRFTDGD